MLRVYVLAADIVLSAPLLLTRGVLMMNVCVRRVEGVAVGLTPLTRGYLVFSLPPHAVSEHRVETRSAVMIPTSLLPLSPSP